ncbi:hypothetical protein [Paractinoplanes brasiliensis]|uniref:Uncharacterized protein n=1 Tax=Paractinoplanes brasiliensis TaxID=52695 RepID=A0A4R6JYP1_9ACTN|nr:hypothetical protein [Actinoplanes brasiliensis]TDO41869.1 hypothetical protein C8E87_5625 [Actinoplanes brasiliensis]GID29851.1 hypothetical protein Abr02nite_48340 [Actinoplanes brasiliensis]
MVPNRSRRAGGRADLVTAGSAVAVGAFGWLVAHTLNFWFIAHSHQGVLSSSGRHVHEVTAAAAVVTGALAAAALVAALLVGGFRPASRSENRNTVAPATGLSTVAFLTADAIEHTVLGLESTPPIVIVFGALLHAAFGAGTSLYWVRLTGGVRIPVVRPVPEPAVTARPRPPAPDDRPWRRLVWAYAVAGRAPPVC